MKRYTFLIILISVILVVQYFPVTSYFCLWTFNHRISENKGYKYNNLLVCAMDNVKDKKWRDIPEPIIVKYTPRADNVTRSVFQRGASFPTGQVILEFLTAERSSSGRLEGYSDIIYIQKKSNNEYENLGTFRKYTP